MISFLIALVFAPMLWGLLWMYTSPLPRLDGHTPVKVIMRIALFAAVFGSFLAQFNFLGHREPPNARRLYGMVLLITEAIPMLFIMFYRYSKEPLNKSHLRNLLG